MGKRILITGGLGFVGREVTRLLYGEHDVLVLDTAVDDRTRLQVDEWPKFKLLNVDIRDAAAVQSAIADHSPEVIIHLAAVHFIPLCERDPVLAVTTNVGGTVDLLTVAPEGCRFVFASSGAVYSPSDHLHVEGSSPVGPRDVYGITKLNGEQYVRYFAGTRQLEAVIVRLFNVVGPGETNRHLVPDLAVQVMAGASEVKLGNTWPKRDYIHVHDAARGFVAAALEGSRHPGSTATVNLGTSRQYSVAEIVEMLGQIAGRPISITTDQERLRAVDRPYLGADISRINRLFGWSPHSDLPAALRDLWSNPDFSEALRRQY